MLLKLDVFIDGELTQPDATKNRRQAGAQFCRRAKDDEDEKDEPGETDVKFQLPAFEVGKQVDLHAYLDKANDAFPLDDQAWLAIGSTRKANILLVGKDNAILDAFLNQEAARKIAAVSRMSPADLKGDGLSQEGPQRRIRSR